MTPATETATLATEKNRAVRHYYATDHTSLTLEQLCRLLDVAKTHGRREFAMVFLGFAHALRVSEICEMTMSNVNLSAKTITVRRKKGSDSGIQEMLNVNCYDEGHVLELWIKERNKLPFAQETDLLFPSPKLGAGGSRTLSQQQFYRLFWQLCEDAGLPEHYRHPHVLKHTCARVLIELGVPLSSVQKRTGHRTLAALQHYTTPSQTDASAICQKALTRATRALRRAKV